MLKALFHLLIRLILKNGIPINGELLVVKNNWFPLSHKYFVNFLEENIVNICDLSRYVCHAQEDTGILYIEGQKDVIDSIEKAIPEIKKSIFGQNKPIEKVRQRVANIQTGTSSNNTYQYVISTTFILQYLPWLPF